MKFQIREGFTVTLQKFIKGDKERNIPDSVRETQHFEGETLDLEPEVASLHKHKLEALDVDAAHFLAPSSIEHISIDAKQVAKDHAAHIAELEKVGA